MASGSGFEVVASDVVHRGAVVTTEIARVRTPEGDIVERQIVRHPGAVGVVAVHNGAVVLVRQYRAAIDAELVEIPAGKLDVAGEPPEEAARRELVEEVGLETSSLQLLGRFYTGAGFCDEQLIIFGTNECVEVPREVEGVEEQHSEIVHVPLAEIESWMHDGRLVDAKSLIGLMWARTAGLLDGNGD